MLYICLAIIAILCFILLRFAESAYDKKMKEAEKNKVDFKSSDKFKRIMGILEVLLILCVIIGMVCYCSENPSGNHEIRMKP